MTPPPGNLRVVERYSGRVTELKRAIRGFVHSGALAPRPGRWPTTSVDAVTVKIVDCPHTTPAWTDSGIVCLRTTNFRVSGLDLSVVRYVSSSTYQERVVRLKPEPGDVVYSREGGILGIACVIPPGCTVCLGQRMLLMRPDTARCLPQYLALVLNAPQTIARVEALTGGTASPHLNVGDVRKFAVPLPPIDVQEFIIAKSQQLLALCDDLEAKLRRAEDRASRLVEAVVREMVA
ncbi:MAG: restriction endonuclease subunit S [Myxococcales bacterium]|nr:MAG: restriction endonuclease subunit S [Myxococcales bacterium]